MLFQPVLISSWWWTDFQLCISLHLWQAIHCHSDGHISHVKMNEQCHGVYLISFFYILWPTAIKIIFEHWCPNYIWMCNLDWFVQIWFCPNVALLLMNHIGTEFQDHVNYIGKMVSGYTSPGFSLSPRFLFERHALGPKKWTWYAEELKIETNTVLNSPTGI